MSEKISSNMAGNVWQVLVAEGDHVEAGSEIAILESMKMEIPIVVEIAGEIEKIVITEGDFVNEGDLIAMIKV